MVINRNKLLKIILEEYKSLLTEEDEDAKVLQFRKPSYEEQQEKQKKKKKEIILNFCKLVGQEWSVKYREYVKEAVKVEKETFSRTIPGTNIVGSIGEPTKQEKDEFEAQKVSRKKELNKIFLKNIREQFDKEIKNFLNANPKLGERLRVSLTEPKINDANYMAQFDKLKKEGEQKFFEGWNPKNPNQDLKQIIYSLYIFFVELCNYKTLAGTSAQPQEPVYKKIPYPGSQKTDGETPPQPPEKPERPNLRIVKEDNRRKNMLVTESKLRQIVKEEYEKLAKEAYGYPRGGSDETHRYRVSKKLTDLVNQAKQLVVAYKDGDTAALESLRQMVAAGEDSKNMVAEAIRRVFVDFREPGSMARKLFKELGL